MSNANTDIRIIIVASPVVSGDYKLLRYLVYTLEWILVCVNFVLVTIGVTCVHITDDVNGLDWTTFISGLTTFANGN